ncbi:MULTISPECIES: UDP-N-acetylmuramoyl-L-alanine--D-glutamate ligase [unclassified Microcoleus]|uniref:UDP-N-acetylmuramoyl-L-alanine--D-glutamate ligase n=1 Tax=unclassified Microcoleus TaxID=2642155 RepID=UPI002FD6C0E7
MPIAHIIGLGKSGIAAARLLKREGWEVTLSDRSSSPNLLEQQQEFANEGINVELGKSFEPVESIELIVVSPGVPWDSPALVRARELGIETIGEMALAWRYLKSPWVGITGTNGKTTTTALIAAIFAEAGLYAPACGNIGYAACELALAEKQPDWVIAEISSYQIESSPFVAPRIGVLTTLTPDHLSRHKTLENYYSIKAHLLKKSELQVINGDDPCLRQQGVDIWPDACWTSVKGKKDLLGNTDFGAYIQDGWVIAQCEKILPADSLRMVGEHNLQNLLMAVAAANLAGLDKSAIARAIAKFPGVSHRLEHICTWEGIDFINDSKATNYDAAQVGLASVSAPAILIAGGDAKEGDDRAWIDTIKAKAAAVLLIGDAAGIFADRLEQANYNAWEIVETMERAIPRAAELGKQNHAKVVLLSPACASFDQYQNFEQRGDHFRQLCLESLI